MADELQVVLSAKDQLSAELKKNLVAVTKLEAAIKEATTAARPDAAEEVKVLTAALEQGQEEAKRLSRQVDLLDDDIDRLGGSAKNTAGDLDRMNRETKKGKAGFAGFAATLKGGGLAAAAAGAALVGTALAIKKVAEVSWQAANQAAAYEKKVRRTDIVFGKYAKRVRAWADANNEAFGKSVDDVAAYAASVGDILKPLGFTTKEATKLTLGVGDLIPALAEWNTVGMDAEQVSYALTSAMTGEREMLKSLGIVIMEEDVKAKVAAMEAAGKFTDETDKQRKAIATLKLAMAGSADAMRSYEGNVGSVGRTMNKLRAFVGDVRDAGLGIIAEAIRNMADAFMLPGNSKRPAALVWLKRNRKGLVEDLMTLASGVIRFGEFSARGFGAATLAMGYFNQTLKPLGGLLSLLPGAAGKVGDAILHFPDNLLKASDASFEMADSLADLADQAFGARDKTAALNTALDTIKNKKVRATVEVAITTVADTVQAAIDAANASAREQRRRDRRGDDGGDTTSPLGVGRLGMAGLRAAHAGYSSALGGHSILSGVRSTNLGSSASDHLHGRAMDIQGPRLGAYANEVRRRGGYAAMHGTGSNRHLHVVPKTHRPDPTAHTPAVIAPNVTVNNPAHDIDIEAAVARGIRIGARQARERSA